MPVIRVDEEVFEELKKQAVHFGLVFEPPNVVLRALLGLDVRKFPAQPPTSGMGVRASGKTTSQKEFWLPILEAIEERGGKAARPEVHKAVEAKMKNILKPGDYELNIDGTPKWVKAVDYQRLAMVHEGLLERGNGTGIWKITQIGRNWLVKHRGPKAYYR